MASVDDSDGGNLFVSCRAKLLIEAACLVECTIPALFPWQRITYLTLNPGVIPNKVISVMIKV